MTGIIASQAFVPNKFSDLAFWYEATDLGTIAESGGAVSSWGVKSVIGVGDAVQAIGSKQPLTGVNTIGGQNVLTFNGAGEHLVVPANAILPGFWSTGGTLLGVHISKTGSFRRIVQFESEFSIYKTADQLILNVSFTGGNTEFRPTFGSFNHNIPELFTITYDASDGDNVPVFYKNGVIITTTSGGPLTGIYEVGSGEMAIGAQLNGGFSINMDMGGLIGYKRILTGNELLEIHAYMISKYRLNISFPLAFSSDFSSDFS